jgi:hypothetical protein
MLTPREREVLTMRRRQAEQKIAAELGTAEKAPSRSTARMMRKMQAASLAALVRAWTSFDSADGSDLNGRRWRVGASRWLAPARARDRLLPVARPASPSRCSPTRLDVSRQTRAARRLVTPPTRLVVAARPPATCSSRAQRRC